MKSFEQIASICTQELPPKWQSFFQQITKQFDLKQYTKALKSANEMLKFYPEHPETMSIKGILLINVDESEWKQGDDPQVLLKAAVHKNVKSAFGWAMLGRFYVFKKAYADAIKCYRMVAKLDPRNIEALFELAKLETHTSDFKALVKTRKLLLSLNPSDSLSWMCLAVAHDLNGEQEISAKLLEESDSIQDRVLGTQETHERAMYYSQILMKLQKYDKALNTLLNLSTSTRSSPEARLLEAQCFFELGNRERAAALYLDSLKEGADYAALLGYIASRASFTFEGDLDQLDMSTKQRQEILAILDEINPPPTIVSHAALKVSTDSEFESRIYPFLKPFVTVNIPAAFNALKPFYTTSARIQAIENCLLRMHDDQCLSKAHGHNPTEILWVYALLFQHYLKISNIDLAEKFFLKAKEHSPTAEIITLLEARLAKKRGDTDTLLKALELATQIALKDRYTSNRYVKHLLRSNKYNEAEKIFRDFNKIEEQNLFKHIFDVQCIWYELELAHSYFKQGDVLSALQVYLAVNSHFDDFAEGTYDFHGYCLHRGTFRAYVDVIRNNIHRKRHPSWIKAAVGIVQCLLAIHDKNDLDSLEEARTAHGRQYAMNPAAIKMPDLRAPLLISIEFVILLMKYDENCVGTVALCGVVYFKLNKIELARSLNEKALALSEKEMNVHAELLKHLLDCQ